MSETSIVAQKPRSFRTSRTVAALMLREMSTTYGRTAFGYLWAILEPAAGILLLTLVFSLALRQPGLGTNFPLYYASALLPFMAYLGVSQKISQALRFSRPLMSIPAVTYMDALLARIILNALTQLLVFSVVMAAIIIGYDLDVRLDYPGMLLGMFMAVFLAFGIGCLNCYLFYRFPMWERIWGIATRPLFFISCVFFLFESVPPPYNDFLWFNPLVHVTGQTRDGVFFSYTPEYVSVLYVMSIAVASTLLGLLLLRRHHREMLNN